MAMTRNQPIRTTCWVTLPVLALVLAGCRSLTEESKPSAGLAVATDPQATEPARLQQTESTPPVKKLNVIWTDATAEASGIPVQSGFAAKVYLVGSESQQPIRAAGKFSFYAWRKDASRPDNIEPDRIWQFTHQQASQQLRQDSIGPFYAFWLPYGSADRSGGDFTVQAAFTVPGRKPVLAAPNVVSLPGSGHKLAWKKKADVLGVAGQHPSQDSTITEDHPSGRPIPENRPVVATPQHHRQR